MVLGLRPRAIRMAESNDPERSRSGVEGPNKTTYNGEVKKFLFLLFLLPSVALSASECSGEKEKIRGILEQGIDRMYLKAAEVDQSTILSPETKADFTQSVDWVVAWTKDHVERLKENIGESGTVREGIACVDLPTFRENVRAQWEPVSKKMRSITVTNILWKIDQLNAGVEDSASHDLLIEARNFFSQAREAMTLREWRRKTNQGIFTVRQVLRTLKRNDIMEVNL